MILTAHQPVYLPWLGLFHKICLADEYVVFDTVQYLKRDWNNRNQIKSVSGPIWLTVPVLSHGKFEQSLMDVKINNETNWRRKHLKSIEINYKNTAYYEKYIGFFRDLYAKEWENLVDINDAILTFLLEAMDINVKIRYGHELNLEGSKSDLVLDMCKKLKADLYIFGTLGRDYAKVDEFKAAGVECIFQDYKHPEYTQQFGEFSPYMSVIDLLFNYGGKSREVIMRGNITKEELLEGVSVS